MAIAAPFAWIEMMTPSATNDGTSVQKESPKSYETPGHPLGSPTHADSVMRCVS